MRILITLAALLWASLAMAGDGVLTQHSLTVNGIARTYWHYDRPPDPRHGPRRDGVPPRPAPDTQEWGATCTSGTTVAFDWINGGTHAWFAPPSLDATARLAAFFAL